VPETDDRARSIGAYAGEVRAFHTFFGAVLILLAALHLFVLMPYVQLHTATPALDAALSDAKRESTAIAEGGKAIEEAAVGFVRYRKALESAPLDLRRAIGVLVDLGRAAAGPGEDPYTASIRVSLPAAAGSAGAAPADTVQVDEAIRREIGRQVEALSLAFDAMLEALRVPRDPPREVIEVMRTAEEGLGRHTLALNGILREAFDADPGFWERLSGDTFAPASPRTEEWARGMAEALRLTEARLTTASSALKSREGAAQARADALAGRHRELHDRLDAFAERLSWLPLGLDGWTRIYPLVAGALAVTALFRLRRIQVLRRALAGVEIDVMAPSWILGAATAPGRWWAMILIALPVFASLHAAVAALQMPRLFEGVFGEPSPPRMVGYAAAYALLGIVGLWQLILVGTGILARSARRVNPGTPSHSSARQKRS
jgi:hypothetical protein